MTNQACPLCPSECLLPDCPRAREWRPGTEEDELSLAHEPLTDDAEGWE